MITRLPAHVHQFGQFQQRLGIEAQRRRYDVGDAVPRQFAFAALADGGHAQAGRPGPARQNTASACSIALGLTNTARSKLSSRIAASSTGRGVFDVADFQHRKSTGIAPASAQGGGEVRGLPGRARHHDMATGKAHVQEPRAARISLAPWRRNSSASCRPSASGSAAAAGQFGTRHARAVGRGDEAAQENLAARISA
jgi:hypothetical protein